MVERSLVFLALRRGERDVAEDDATSMRSALLSIRTADTADGITEYIVQTKSYKQNLASPCPQTMP